MTRDDDSSEEAAAPRGNVVPPRMYPLRPVTQPDYPDESALFKEEGTVILLLRVGSDGDVVDAWVSKTSGYDRLDQSAVKEAIASWKLKPGTVNGIPTTMDHEFAVRFKLAD